MSERAQNLADQFGQSSRAFITTIESLEPEQLQARCAGEQCTVAALGVHVAGVHQSAAEWIQAAASGQSLPVITMDMIHRANAVQFERDAGRPKDEVLEELRQHGARAARIVRGLGDDELDRQQYFSLFEDEITTEDLVRNVLIADVQEHLASLEQIFAGSPSTT